MTECWRGEGAQYRNVITHYCQNNINIIIVLSGVKFLTFAQPQYILYQTSWGPAIWPNMGALHVRYTKYMK